MPSAKNSAVRRSLPKAHSNYKRQKHIPSNSSFPSSIDPAETLPARRLLCAIIEQAWIDLKPATPLEKDSKEFERRQDRLSACRFFESTEFAILCDVLRLSPEAIRAAARRLTPALQHQ